jgi:hypothetical protein
MSGTVRWETRVIWRRLDCLKPNLQEMKVHIRRKGRLEPAPALRCVVEHAVATFGARCDAQ